MPSLEDEMSRVRLARSKFNSRVAKMLMKIKIRCRDSRIQYREPRIMVEVLRFTREIMG